MTQKKKEQELPNLQEQELHELEEQDLQNDEERENMIENIAYELIDELLECRKGTVTSTARLAGECGYELEMSDLLQLHGLLFELAEENQLLLDMSEHEGKVEGLPFNLTFVVRHRKK